MDAALGSPEKMAERREELTPMLSQYLALCEQYEDALVLFQVGDFYETFCEAAETCARILEITLTKREDSTGRYPMAGIPIDSAESYIETLLDAGYRVAVADQVEDPEEASGVVERAVTRIVTPGTLTEDELLETDDNNFVACLTRGKEPGDPGRYGLALLDVSTGDFVATSTDSAAAIRDEVRRFGPTEAIAPPGGPPAEEAFGHGCMVTPFREEAFDRETARATVAAYFGGPDHLLGDPAEVRACGALLAYAEYTRGITDADGSTDGAGRLDYVNHLTRYDPREYMLLDAVALRSLELFERRAVRGDEEATLVGVLDETASALGGRKLRNWLRRPLVDADRIEGRLDAVEELTGDPRTREGLADLLADVYDVERLITRVSRGRANGRDLRSLKDTLDVVPRVREAVADADAEKLRDLRAAMDELEDVRDLIGRAIREEPPIELTEGDIIKEGYDEDLDALRETEREGKQWVDALEADERERTGIDSLKVGYNSVHGYYIEVTDSNLDRVPDDYTRRQTLKNSERFYTPELKRREEEIVSAEQRADDREYDLFTDVRADVAAESERVQAVADALAELDALVALAEVAATRDYARPEIGGSGIEIRGGRHPVVERAQANFVPNDARLDAETPVALVTGPNMSGKSTYLRQVALVAVLAQIGSFVPASEARIELVDRVFTRVGTSDDIAGGQSTFMVEMAELAEILRGATERSLILLDEVGRGTSTADGRAIARAVLEYVHDEVGARTLFATHHHALTDVAADLEGARNLHFTAAREDGETVFEHEVAEGPATASYGVEVARAAGLPEGVVERASALLEDAGDPRARANGSGARTRSDDAADATDARREATNGQAAGGVDAGATEPGTEGERGTEVVDELRRADLATTTPMEALTLLHDLKRTLENG